MRHNCCDRAHIPAKPAGSFVRSDTAANAIGQAENVTQVTYQERRSRHGR
jgi:hypothetical protein